ncbi:MAG: hypothetical protein JSV16_11605 [Candidatus Hydrogenedentota bacterium]|nr:MAG: hypothetical protein JSV16_11605 [Candidatus Hydrogenedentota bacterium]
MTTVLVVGIVFSSILAAIGIIAGTIVALARNKRSGRYWKGHDPPQANETRLTQELHEGFLRMEERVEALETILLDRESKEGTKRERKMTNETVF